MKPFSTLACLLIACAACFPQTAPSPRDAEAQELIAKSKSVLEAMKAKDPARLTALLAPDFHAVDMAGDLSSRDEMLGAVHGGLKDFVFYEPQALRIDADSVVVVYSSAVSLTDEVLKEMAQDNLSWPRYSKVSDLWVRQSGDWKLKFEQVTPLRAMY